LTASRSPTKMAPQSAGPRKGNSWERRHRRRQERAAGFMPTRRPPSRVDLSGEAPSLTIAFRATMGANATDSVTVDLATGKLA